MADLLVVDDQPEMAVLIRRLARRDGHTVRAAPDVAGAWACLAEARPDLALVDVNLLGESGLVLCRMVRADPQLSSLPLALLARLGLPEDVAGGWDAGADFLLSKDLLAQPEEARARLAEILAGAHGRPPEPLLTCSPFRSSSPAPASWVGHLNGLFSHPFLRHLDRRVLRSLLARALRRADGGQAGRSSPWLQEGGGPALADDNHPRRADEVVGLLDELAEQFWRLLGAEESAPPRALLADVAHAILLVEDPC